MDPSRFEQLQRLFLEASEVPPAERQAWVESRCGSDVNLCNELSELLQRRDHEATIGDAGAPSSAMRPGDAQPGAASQSALPSIAGYHIVREIARGGQTVVYEGVQVSTSQRVAIKVLLGAEFSSQAEKERQDREVRVLATIQHPHIVGIIDRGRTTSGVQFVVLPYIDGRPLDDHLHFLEQARPVGECHVDLLPLFVKIARAVGVAHRSGVVHRDLKPSNIFIDQHGEPRILDFGLARILPMQPDGEDAVGRHNLTVTGSFVGSLAWASPEQAAGNVRQIGFHTDVYALGVILFQMLTGGQFPYQVVGNIRDVLDNILNAAPKPPSDVCSRVGPSQRTITFAAAVNTKSAKLHPAVDAIVLKALTKSPADRYPDANAFADDVEKYLTGRPTVATPQPVTRSTASAKPRSRRLFVAIGTAAALAAAAILFQFVRPAMTGGNREAPVTLDTDKAAAKPLAGASGQLSRTAFVSAPAKLPGVNSWTVETKRPRDSTQVIWDPKNRFLLSIGWRDGAIRVHRLPDFETTRILIGHDTTHLRARISPDGEFLAVRGAIPRLLVFEIATGKIAWTADCSAAFAFSGDGKQLLFRNRDKWHWNDVPTGKPATWTAVQAALNKIATQCGEPDFTSDNRLIAVPVYPDHVDVIDWQTGELKKTLTGPTGESHDFSVQFSPDGQKLLSHRYMSNICVWDVPSGQFLRTLSLDNGTPIKSKAHPTWADESKTVAALPVDSRPVLIDVETGDTKFKIQEPGDSVSSSPDTLSCAVSNIDRIAVFNRSSEKLTFAVRSYRNPYNLRNAISQSSNLLALSGRDGRLLIWRLDKDAEPRKVDSRLKRSCEFLDVSNDGKLLIVGEREGGLALVSVPAADAGDYAVRLLSPESTGLRAVRISASGDRAFVINGESKLKVIQTGPAEVVGEIPLDLELTVSAAAGANQRVNMLAVSNDGKLVAIAGKSRGEKPHPTIIVVDCQNKNEISRLELDAEAADLALSPRVEELAWIDTAGRVTVRNYRTKKLGESYEHRQLASENDYWKLYERRAAIAWGRDAQTLTTIRSNTAVTWNRQTQSSFQTNGRHLMATASSLPISLGGYGRIAIDQSDERTRIWDTKTGEPISTLFFANEAFLAVSPEGHFTGPDGIEKELLYVVEEAGGNRSTLTPDQFSQRFGWQNDPKLALPRLDD